MLEKGLTPEKQWDKVKKLLFKEEVPESIEELMKKGFKESLSESEKWERLSIFLIMIKGKFG
jgi:hypothetical protein